MAIRDESDVSGQHIHEVTVLIVLFIMSFLFTVCLTATILLTKTIRSQTMGILLINMSIAVFIFQVIARPVTIRENLHYSDTEKISCHLIYIVTLATTTTFNLTLVLLGIDATFNLSNSVIVRMSVTIAIWILPFVLAVVELHGEGSNYIKDIPRLCQLTQRYPETFKVLVELTHVFMPLVGMLLILIIIMVKFCRARCNDQSIELTKAIPFLISAVIILISVSPLRIVYILKENGWNVPITLPELYHWTTLVQVVLRPVICIIWVFMFRGFRKTTFRKTNTDGESRYLLNNK